VSKIFKSIPMFTGHALFKCITHNLNHQELFVGGTYICQQVEEGRWPVLKI